MSGSLISSGMLTNEGNNFLNIQNDLDKRINSIIIYNIPLSHKFYMTGLKTLGKLITPFIHSAFTPTFSHIAIGLFVEESDFFYIIEYGQYYSRDSMKRNSSFSSSSSNEPNESKNNHDYYYINEDGVRITRISILEISNELEKDHTYRFFRLFENVQNEDFKRRIYKGMDNIIIDKIAEGFFGEINDENVFKRLKKFYKTVKCVVKNKITLRELCNNCQNENWLAKKYNVAFHNCQTFAAELIKILKAIREEDEDKIRFNEKQLLPNCLIKALRDNEDFSWINTGGRIPIAGLLWDIGWKIRYAW